ncbi:hypothetical protein NECAME_16538 [Necator americanus]|uniref:ZP domain-containing protein n=1 Tax=Necator americanus TaxID=51031 RepID=W2TVY6_NECAM|nr:hypothetical protein NECAME_16538 [Necator americanus]ETN85998.1 hypothetical protein NECAME_16538 [Necator americanus]
MSFNIEARMMARVVGRRGGRRFRYDRSRVRTREPIWCACAYIGRVGKVNPRGMAFSMTVVVQLHPLFITKVDRAYHVRCFYMEAEKAVGAQIGVK